MTHRINDQVRQAKAETDETRSAEMYTAICKIARDEGGTSSQMFVNFVYARRGSVQHGPSVAASWEADGARSASRWWFV